MTTSKAKSEKEKGKNGDTIPPEEITTTPPETPPEETVTPPPEKAESLEPGPDDTVKSLTQKQKTLLGQHKKLQTDYATLEAKVTSFEGIGQKMDDLSGQIQEHGVTLNLLTDIVSAGAEYNEDLQEKIKKSREAQETNRERQAKAFKTMADIKELTDTAGVDLKDERLKPAKEAFEKGDYAGAIKLTTISLISRPATPPTPPPDAEAEAKKKPVDKGKLTQITSPPGAITGIEDKTRKQKILDGLLKHREGQS